MEMARISDVDSAATLKDMAYILRRSIDVPEKQRAPE